MDSKWKLVDALAKGSTPKKKKKKKPMAYPKKAPKGGVTVPLQSIKDALKGKGTVKK